MNLKQKNLKSKRKRKQMIIRKMKKIIFHGYYFIINIKLLSGQNI